MIITLAAYDTQHCTLFDVIVPALAGFTLLVLSVFVVCLFGAGCGRRRKFNRPTAICIILNAIISFIVEVIIIEQIFQNFNQINKCLDNQHETKSKEMLGIALTAFLLYSIMFVYAATVAYKTREVWFAKK